MPTPEKILVRSVNWLGDAVMSTAALQRLREARPGASITLLSPEKLAALWQGQPFVDETLAFSPGESVWRVGQRLRDKGFTTGVVFPNSVRSALELWLAGIPRRIGYARPWRNFFLTQQIGPRAGAVPMQKRSTAEIRQLISTGSTPAPIPASAHHIHDYLRLTEALGASPEPLPPRIFISDQEVTQTGNRFGLQADLNLRPWFGINPGAEYGPAKRWPADRFAAAAVALCKQTNCRWLIFGGASDHSVAEAIAVEIGRATGDAKSVMNLAGKTNLREFGAALKLCRLLLTNDTGPMHLAAAVGTPVVVPFGSTSPELTGPAFGPAEILRAKAPCAPCFRRDCPIDLRCLTGIEVGTVVEAAMRIFKNCNLPAS
jgi:lipopolysaccharide heptosyltransferase II